jgi:formylglycine-generating enzyme required for sulfatase activity
MDIYALGCTVFEMITGRVPYLADTPIAQILMHLQHPVPSLKTYVPDISDEIDDVVRRAMAKAPGDRYATASDFAHALSAVSIEGLSIADTLATPRAGASTIPGAIPAGADHATGAPEPVARGHGAAPAAQQARRTSPPMMLYIGAGAAVVVVIGVVLLGIILLSRGARGAATQEVFATDIAGTEDAIVALVSSTPEPLPTSTAAPVVPTSTPTPGTTDTPTPGPTATTLPETTFLRGVQMVLVPGGTFTMGRAGTYPNEAPPHEVYLDPYYIDQTEVTNLYYRACVQEGGCETPEFITVQVWDNYFGLERFNNYPVAYISWPEAQNYCRWRGGNLPTEAQWEKAARYDPVNGNEQDLFPWGNTAPSLYYANFGAEIGRPEPVGARPAGASPVGAYDMSGNMIEWVYDWYQDNYYEHSPHDNPTGPLTGAEKILRGGWWGENGAEIGVTFRASIGPGTKQIYIGFRCAYTPSGDPTLNADATATAASP